jgi:kelch-like protein 1/4/5
VVVGGRDGLKTMNLVDCFDLESKSWNSLPSMTTPRHGLGKALKLHHFVCLDLIFY